MAGVWMVARQGLSAEDRVRHTGLEAGLVDNKICAIDEIWSGLRFVYRLEGPMTDR